MPRYELTTDEELTGTQKVALARAITEVHASVTGAPPSLVHVVYRTTGPGNAFVAGEARPGTFLQGFIRAGRDAETTTKLLIELSAAITRITGAPVEDVTVALREGLPRLVLEGGRLLPEPGQEDDMFRH
jgi:phenylpyruvate tautomerase PptA (4-oxalocrotonate tautomerase family)